MTPERWQILKEIFEGALELDPETERVYLDQKCSLDSELRADVESLLRAHGSAQGFIEAPVEAGEDFFDAEGVDSFVCSQVGPYRIERAIGSGGMGAVYLGVRADDEYQKQVAIKIVRSGMSSGAILRRFRHERQILANLDHPNIARLFDGGTADGRPYFVMEYVDGAPIDEYCVERRLPLEQRLRLFQVVCKAVHFAHQNLVVHRDIKPANVLVTAVGVPKLLDFGIATLVDSSGTDAVQTITFLMTPLYASPEQVRGEAITTATDVYSLGVLLYGLLTGRGPYRVATSQSHELAQAICDGEPIAPGVNSDVDNIILKALRKELHSRYSSALEFSEDIERYLRGMPVTARPDTLRYRAHKFVLRHKLGVTLSSAATVMLIAALAVTAVEYRIAENERAHAERRFNEVRQLANTFMFQIHDSIKDLPGSTLARENLVKTALEYLDRLSQESDGDRDLQGELATAYEKVAEIQNTPGSASLRDAVGADGNLRKALALRELRAQADPKDWTAKGEWARSLLGLAFSGMQTKENVPLATKAVEILEEVDKAVHLPESRERLARGYYVLGSAFIEIRNLEKGIGAFDKNIQILEEFVHDNAANTVARSNIALTNKRIGALLGMNNRLDEAFARYQKALQEELVLLQSDPISVDNRRSLSVTYSDLAWLHGKSGNIKAALDSYMKAYDIRQALLAADPANVDIRIMLASTHTNIGLTLQEKKDWAGAMDHLRKALMMHQAMFEENPSNPERRAGVANSYYLIASLGYASGHLQEALQNHEKAFSMRRNLVKAYSANRRYKVDFVVSGHALGLTFNALTRYRATGALDRCQGLSKVMDLFSEVSPTLLSLSETGQLLDQEKNQFAGESREYEKIAAEFSKCPVDSLSSRAQSAVQTP